MPSTGSRVIRAVISLMYSSKLLQHLSFRRKLCLSLPKSLKQPGKGSSSRCKLQQKLIQRGIC